jgi:chloride channel protein, CIC family
MGIAGYLAFCMAGGPCAPLSMAITSGKEKLGTMETVHGPDDPAVAPEPGEAMNGDTMVIWKPGFLITIIAIALVAIMFTAAFMAFYTFLEKVIWLDNEFVLSNRWTIPVGVLFFSLLVGLCQKYLHAPTMIEGGFTDALMEGKLEENHRTFPGAFCSSILSLVSGASVGPEGTITLLVGQIASWIRERFRVAGESETTRLGFDTAALASAFNGIIGSPVFTGVLATEFQIGKKNAYTLLIWNLVAGLVGYLFYLALGFASFYDMVPLPPVDVLSPGMILCAVLLGVVGSLLALFAGLAMQGFGKVMEAAFSGRVILRTLAAGAVIAAVCYFLPALLFSGEAQIHPILSNPAGVGVALLLLYGVLKILLLALSFKSGFVGGPIFPILFSSTMIGLALSLLFPSVPVAIFVLCIEAAAIALGLGAPLTAMLLVVVVSAPSVPLTALIVTSAVTAMVFGAIMKERVARRNRKKIQPVARPV